MKATVSSAHLSLGVRLRGIRILVVRSLPTGPHWRSASFGPQFTRWSVCKSTSPQVRTLPQPVTKHNQTSVLTRPDRRHLSRLGSVSGSDRAFPIRSCSIQHDRNEASLFSSPSTSLPSAIILHCRPKCFITFAYLKTETSLLYKHKHNPGFPGSTCYLT